MLLLCNNSCVITQKGLKMVRKKGKTISVANEKGGVTKTTTCRMLADIYLEKGLKVLMIDFDPQASLTKGYKLDPKSFQGTSSHNICNIFKKEAVSAIAIKSDYGSLHLIPSNKELKTLGQTSVIGKDLILKRFIKQHNLKEQYDVIIIDNNPKFDTATISAILAADILLIPVVTAKDEQEGLHGFIEDAEETLQMFDHKIEKICVLPTKYDKKTKVGKIYKKIIEDETIPFIEKNCPILSQAKNIILSTLPESIAFKDAASYNISVYNYLKEHGNMSSMKKEKRIALLQKIEDIAENILKA